jgi:hypothetical protein
MDGAFDGIPEYFYSALREQRGVRSSPFQTHLENSTERRSTDTTDTPTLCTNFSVVFITLVRECYQQDTLHPLKSDLYNKENRITHGKVYASTMRMLEDIQQAGYQFGDCMGM